MNLRTIGVIINREYSTRVKKKTFLLTTFLVPVLLALCGVAMGVMMVNVKEKTKTVGVVDESGIVMSYLKNSEQISFQDMSSEPLDTVKARLADLGLDGVLSISKIDEQKNLQASFTSVKPVGMGVTATMSR